MPRTLITSRLPPNKHIPKTEQEPYNTKPALPPHLQSLKQQLLSENGFLVYK